MLQPEQDRIYTTNDIYALPDGQRAELIDGQMFLMAPPDRKHQRITGKLYQKIANYIDLKNGSCEVYAAPFAVFLNADNKVYVEPDISVICDKNKLTDKGCNGAPDWIIEIVSPSSQRMDYLTKLFKYRSAGIREYWIVNPMKEIVQVYNFIGKEDSILSSFDETIPSQTLDGLEICISDLLE